MAAPNSTLYVNNLNDKVNKHEIRAQLYALFTTYGKLIDVVASKGPEKRGQAFLVFADLAGATAAMRACEGMLFYDKPLVCAHPPAIGYPMILFYFLDTAHPLCKDQVARDAEEGRPLVCSAVLGPRRCCRSAEWEDQQGEAAAGPGGG